MFLKKYQNCRTFIYIYIRLLVTVLSHTAFLSFFLHAHSAWICRKRASYLKTIMGYLTHFVTAFKSKIWTRRMFDYVCIVYAGHEAFESRCDVCNAYQGFMHFSPLSQESASSSQYSVNLF